MLWVCLHAPYFTFHFITPRKLLLKHLKGSFTVPPIHIMDTPRRQPTKSREYFNDVHERVQINWFHAIVFPPFYVLICLINWALIRFWFLFFHEEKNRTEVVEEVFFLKEARQLKKRETRPRHWVSPNKKKCCKEPLVSHFPYKYLIKWCQR